VPQAGAPREDRQAQRHRHAHDDAGLPAQAGERGGPHRERGDDAGGRRRGVGLRQHGRARQRLALLHQHRHRHQQQPAAGPDAGPRDGRHGGVGRQHQQQRASREESERGPQQVHRAGRRQHPPGREGRGDPAKGKRRPGDPDLGPAHIQVVAQRVEGRPQAVEQEPVDPQAPVQQQRRAVADR